VRWLSFGRTSCIKRRRTSWWWVSKSLAFAHYSISRSFRYTSTSIWTFHFGGKPLHLTCASRTPAHRSLNSRRRTSPTWRRSAGPCANRASLSCAVPRFSLSWERRFVSFRKLRFLRFRLHFSSSAYRRGPRSLFVLLTLVHVCHICLDLVRWCDES
jgi:hypothetical protein